MQYQVIEILYLTDVFQHIYVTQYIHKSGLESQISSKTVNLIFQSVTVNNKLTIWGGG